MEAMFSPNSTAKTHRKTHRNLFADTTEDTASTSGSASGSTFGQQKRFVGALPGPLYLNAETVFDQAGRLSMLKNIRDKSYIEVFNIVESTHLNPRASTDLSLYKGPTYAIKLYQDTEEDVTLLLDSVEDGLEQTVDLVSQQLEFVKQLKTDPQGAVMEIHAANRYLRYAMAKFRGSFPIEAFTEATVSHYLGRPQVNIHSVSPFELGQMLSLSNDTIIDLPLSTKRDICNALIKAQYFSKNPHFRKLLLIFSYVKALHADFSPRCIFHHKEYNATAFNVLLKVYTGSILHTKLYNFMPATADSETLIPVHSSLTVFDRIKQVKPDLAQQLLILAPVRSMDWTLPGQTVTTTLPPTEKPTPSNEPSSWSDWSVQEFYKPTPAVLKIWERVIGRTNIAFGQVQVAVKDSSPETKAEAFRGYAEKVWTTMRRAMRRARSSSEIATKFCTPAMEQHMSNQATHLGVDPNIVKEANFSPMKE